MFLGGISESENAYTLRPRSDIDAGLRSRPFDPEDANWLILEECSRKTMHSIG